MPGHREHKDPLSLSIPSHHWHIVRVKVQIKTRRWCTAARIRHEVLTQRGVEPCRQVMRLLTRLRTGGPPVS